MQKNSKVKWMVEVAMLSAVAMALMLLEFPLPFIAPPFYELDFSEVPVLVGAFALGPVAGVAIEGIKVLLNLAINGTITAGVGETANFLVGIAFVLPAGLIYKQKKTKKTAIIGMTVGGTVMAIFSCFVNAYMLIPAYGAAMGLEISTFVKMAAEIHSGIDSLFEMVLFCVLPFNLIKVILVSALTTFLYKHISPILKGRN
ncbi:MAG: ECF transporter S component [Clostridia bacterium]|nr:ECF transporter S component [Clostridia bacterium]